MIGTAEGAAGLGVLACLALAALLAPWFFPGDPRRSSDRRWCRRSATCPSPWAPIAWVRSVGIELIYGARTTLLVAIASAATALGIGTLVGTLAAFFGGIVDELHMRITEAFQTIPAFLLSLAFISVTGPAVPTIVLAMALGAWPQPARIARAEVLSLRERDFVAAARVIGMHPLEIAVREILLNALTPVASLAAVIVAAAVLIEAALSFLGLGDPNRVTWGSMIAEGRTVLREAPFLSIVPGLALVVTALAVHLTGPGLHYRDGSSE